MVRGDDEVGVKKKKRDSTTSGPLAGAQSVSLRPKCE